MVKIYAANWILTGEGQTLQNYAVVIREGKIFDIGPVSEIESKYSNRVYDLGNSIIFPAFVNAHTHLELTCIRDSVVPSGGFLPWMREASQSFRSASDEDILNGIRDGLAEIRESGTIGIGETTSSDLSMEPIIGSELYAQVFHEVQGFRNFRVPYLMQDVQERLMQFQDTDQVKNRISPHSPYLVGRKLFQEIEQRESLMSVHLASLPEEVEFLGTGTGPIKQLLLAREMYDYKWEVPGLSPVRYFFENYYYAHNNILVHMIHVSDEDMDFIAESHVNVHICLCPRAHNQLGLEIAPALQYKKRGLNLCLGTDSVSASGDYDMRNEMRAAAEFYQLDPPEVLALATINGAQALQFDEVIGSIAKGKSGQLLAMNNPFAVDKDPYEALLESEEPLYWIDQIPTTEPGTS